MKISHPKLNFEIEVEGHKSVFRYPQYSVDGGPGMEAIAVLLTEVESLKAEVAVLKQSLAGTTSFVEAPPIVVSAEITPDQVPDLANAESVSIEEVVSEEPGLRKFARVNPNLDSVEAIEGLPHIGQKIAEKIVALREEKEFADFEDFYKRSGLKLKAGDKEVLAKYLEFQF